jgi:prevent-host-death family protein
MRRVRDHQERFIVDRRGKPQVVILSVEDYFQNVVKQPKSLTRLQEEAKRRGLDKLSMEEIQQEVRRIRGVIRKTKHRDAF